MKDYPQQWLQQKKTPVTLILSAIVWLQGPSAGNAEQGEGGREREGSEDGWGGVAHLPSAALPVYRKAATPHSLSPIWRQQLLWVRGAVISWCHTQQHFHCESVPIDAKPQVWICLPTVTDTHPHTPTLLCIQMQISQVFVCAVVLLPTCYYCCCNFSFKCCLFNLTYSAAVPVEIALEILGLLTWSFIDQTRARKSARIYCDLCLIIIIFFF